ncbi:MAG: efflux RND transporter periplasmic adaptor subunit [Burkholderiaceae bacterium]|nr:efflux RND transporter periplasmic adaptor subunit [Burkholderiaceae bacterium]
MGRRGWVAGGVAVALLLGLGGWALRSAQGSKARPADTPPPLEFAADELVRPLRQTLPRTLSFSGALVAPGTAVLRAKSAGTLLELSVREGDRVRAGQLLGRIDDSELLGRLREREAAAAAARAQFQLAERQHRANEGLAAQQFIAATALETSRSQMDAARAQWESAQAQLATLQLAQRDVRLRAPIDGIVARRQALPGEQVAPEQPVLTLVDLRRLELAGMVGTHEVGLLRPGQPVRVQVEGQEEAVAARIARIAPAAEPGSRSIGVTVALDNPDERLRAGQYALAQVTLEDDRLRLTLPEAALSSSGGQSYVWTLEAGRLMRRAVTPGRRDPASGRVELLGGLSEEVVVLAGRFDNLREGAAARARPAAAPPAPSSAPSSVASARSVSIAASR